MDNKNEFLARFVSDLELLGLRPGGVLLVHASLRAFGRVPGGAETIIQGLARALGREGTLLLPALSYETVTPQRPWFDIRSTPACVGAIPEHFRTRPGTRRSFHPTHSLCAVGPLAEELLAPHVRDATPCGPNSPFHQLPACDGQILMLGCGLRSNTSMHAIEELVEPEYLFNPPLVYTLTDASGQTTRKSYTPHNFKGFEQRYDRVAAVLAAPELRRGSVAGAASHLLEARALWRSALAQLEEDPLYFVDRVQPS